MKYPSSVKTDSEKLAYLCRCHEKLNLEFNEMGQQFREGEITPAQWGQYKQGYFLKINAISPDLSQFQEVKKAQEVSRLGLSAEAAQKYDFFGQTFEPLRKDATKDEDINLDELVK